MSLTTSCYYLFMKYTFGGGLTHRRKLFTIYNIKSTATMILVAFLILSFPAQSFAGVITNGNSDKSTKVGNDITTKIDAPLPTVSNTISNDKKGQVIDVMKEKKDDQVSAKVAGPASNVMLRISVPGGESTVSQDDVANVHTGGTLSYRSGAFEYSYPITVPEGRNGLTPSVSLEYSSQMGDYVSPFGYGWSMGIPKIERMNLTGTNKLYTDNFFSSTLDGQLVAISSSTYKAKVESGSFNSYNFSNDKWIVYDKVGNRYTFGSTTSARQDNASNTAQIATWMLEEIMDSNGEKISYTYYKNNGQIYPSTISYVYVSGVSSYVIKFLRSTTTVSHSQFKKGFEEKRNYVISSIEVSFANNKIAQYDLSYGFGASHSNILFSSIQKTGYDIGTATTSLPATTFTYKENPSTISFTSTSTWASTTPKDLYIQFNAASGSPSGSSTGTYYRTKLIDMNGDGLADWVNNGEVHMNTGSGWTATATWTGLPLNSDPKYQLVDINGDGLPDLVKAASYVFHPSLGLTNYKDVEFKFNNGDGTWSTNSAWSTTTPLLFYTETTSATNSVTYTRYKNYLTDMNGDGLVDWIYSGGVYMHTGSGWSASSTWTGLPGNFEGSYRLEDVNGDSLPDLLRGYKKTYDPSYSSSSPITDYSVQLNKGDGTWQTDAYWSSTIPGPIYVENQVSASVAVLATPHDVYLQDVNGDGFSEWLVGTALYKSVGNGWSASSSTLPISTDSFARELRFTDINGDQTPDIVTSWTNTWDNSYGISDQVIRGINISSAKKIWMLASTTNETGGETEVIYTPSTFLQNGTLPNPNSPYSIYAVTAIVNNPKIGARSTTTYQYSGGDLYFNPADILSRKFAGFNVVTETSDLGKTKTYYHQGNESDSGSQESADGFAKIGVAYRIESTNLNGNIFKLKINRYATSSLGNGSTYVRSDRETTFAYDGDSDHRDTAVEYTYDTNKGVLLSKIDWGEVSASSDGSFSDVSGDKRTSTYNYASSTVNNITAILSSLNVKNEANATTSDTRLYYDTLALGSVAKGNLTKTESLATSTYINTQSTYNSSGLKLTDTDARGYVTTYVYDPYTLFPATTTNALSQSSRFIYDYSSGKPLTVIDANNLTTSYVYDGLDRTLEEKVPDPSTGTNSTKTKYVYTDIAGSSSVKVSNYISSSTIKDSYSYFDGFGREIQSRVGAEISNQFVVKDTVFGPDGLVLKTSLPYYANGAGRSTATTTNALFTSLGYDALGRVASTSNVSGTAYATYDQWVTTEKNVLGKDKDTISDAYGRLLNVAEHNGTNTYSTVYQWDDNDNLVKITDALGNVRNFTYDNLSRRLSMQDLHSTSDNTFGTWNFVYDAAGNLTSKTDPKGQVVQYTYDNISRPLTENYTGAAGTEVVYVYDSCTRGVGQVCSVANNSATTSYTYAYNLSPATEGKTIGTTTFTTTNTYDLYGNQTLIVYPDSSEVRNTYNIGNQLEKVEQKESGGSWRDVVSNFDYHPNGQVAYEVKGNGTKTTKTYDPSELYRLRSIVTTASSTFGTGGGGDELAEFERGLSNPSVEEQTKLGIQEVIPEVTTKGDDIEATDTEDLQDLSKESTTTTNTATATTTDIASSTVPEILFGIPTTTEAVGTEIIDTNAVTTEATSTEMVEVSVPPLMDVDVTSTDKLITNLHEARVWQKFHSERLAGLQDTKDVSTSTLKAAQYAKDKFDSYLIQKEYMEVPDGPIRASIKDRVYNNLKGTKQSILDIFSYLLPEKAYAYMFGAETFESCSSIPCSFTSNVSWGAVTPSIDTTSRINGVKSLKAVITGEGAGAMENSGYDTGEIWAQFKVYIPTTMTWGPSGYFNLLRFEDTSNNAVFWMTVEDWGTARLTVMGDTLGWTNTGLDLPKGATSTIEVRFKKGTTNGDVDIWLNNTNSASPSYNGSGTLNTGTDNVDDVQFGVAYAPENGIATTYYDDAVVNSAFIGTLTSAPTVPFAVDVQRLNYTYDSLGNITQIADTSNTNASTTVSYTYDDLSRLTSATAVGGTAPYTETYSYNAIGDLITKSDIGTYVYAGDSSSETTYPIYSDSIASGWSSYSWNVTLNPSNTSPVFSGTYSLRAAYSTAWGGMSYHTNSINSSPYNKLRLNVYVGTSTSVQLMGYFNNASGTPLAVVNLGSYVSGGWLTNTWQQIEVPFSALNFTSFSGATEFNIESSLAVPIIYDQIELVGGASSQNYANPHAATSIAGITQNYDQNGNLASSTVLTNAWSYDNRLINITRGSTSATYSYDTSGIRVKKVVGSNTTVYPSNLYEKTNATTTKHIYANGVLIASIKADTPAAKIYYNHSDHLGSTAVVTDKDGYLDQVLGYKPFGNSRVEEKYGDLNQSNRYVGQDYDPESSLSYLNARYQNGVEGRFISEDPVFWGNPKVQDLKNPQNLNSYSYGSNNPILNKDPDGKASYIFNNGVGMSSLGDSNATYYEQDDINMLNNHASFMSALSYVPVPLFEGGIFALLSYKKMPWDYNNKERPMYFFDGQLVNRETFGNEHYGYVGSAGGYSASTLKFMGGAVQVATGYAKLSNGIENYFDQPHDQVDIQKGINSYNSNSSKSSSSNTSKSSSSNISSKALSTASSNLSSAQKALAKGDYSGAIKALSNASKALDSKRK